ncbi:antibiotic biosynthesis monooxygenase [Mangrovihabitans endophyticus]|uniref:Antibiotic biosynthesis monooxygenase n=1 Tax=Mangrovihabitans endophyticus TaxID=1751298 RepID=A0A8J3FRY4_9ACTN|nr:antibiotic biosynthesis monooxygenase [Mangrovihabitans endophyticus]GGL10613.1 antibiotic biosynthesis monooxygenase [Mangrovihabitans endophyticus]
MIDITDPAAGMVQLVIFTVDPARQQQVAVAVAATVEQTVAHRPGFLSATYHLSLDGTQILNYAQWASKKDFDAFVADQASQNTRAEFAALDGVRSTTGSAWCVHRTVTAGTAR